MDAGGDSEAEPRGIGRRAKDAGPATVPELAPATRIPAPPHLGYAKQGQQEGPEGDAEREEFPVSFQDLEVIGQAGDDRLHAAHLEGTRQE